MYSMPHRYSEHDLEHFVGLHADHPLSTTQQHVAWENNLLRVECNLVHHLQTLEDRQAVRIMPAAESYYAAVVVPVASDDRFHLVGRYRYAVDGWSLEFPRFDLETGDDGWKDAAGVDLLRIAGLKAERLVLLGALQIDPALLSTSAVVVLAEGCRPAASTKLATATGTAQGATRRRMSPTT